MKQLIDSSFKRKRYLRLRERGLKEGDLLPSSKSTKEGLLSFEEKCLVGGGRGVI